MDCQGISKYFCKEESKIQADKRLNPTVGNFILQFSIESQVRELPLYTDRHKEILFKNYFIDGEKLVFYLEARYRDYRIQCIHKDLLITFPIFHLIKTAS